MTDGPGSKAHMGNRVRDFSVYIAIGLLVAATAWIVASTNLNLDVITRWGGLAANTALVYGYFIADSRSFFGQRAFWAVTSVALAVHLIIFAIVLTHVAQWKLLWFMVMLLEIPVLVFLRDRLPGRGSK